MIRSISCSRRFAPTPPTSRTSSLPVSDRARSVTSTHMAKAVSCRLKQTSGKGALFSFAAETSPENARSIPLTV